MAKTAKSVTINGHSYLIGQHGPDAGDEIVAYLAKILAPAGMAFAAGMDEDAFGPEMGKALAGALAGVTGKDHARFMRQLLSVCTVNNLPLDGPGYDSHFGAGPGTIGERYQAAVEVIRHNGFFAVIGALKAAMPTGVPGSNSLPT